MNLFLTQRPRHLDNLRGEFDRLFDRFFTDLPSPRTVGSFLNAPVGTFPALNVWEDKDNLYAECELPGVKMDDLDVTVVGNELTIKGERLPYALEGATFHRRERGAGSFSRLLRLPVRVEADKVSAQLKDGVLTVTLPKTREAKPRKIAVKLLK